MRTEARSSQELLERLSFAERLLFETPIIRLDHEPVDLYAKLEFLNGFGSIKDRPAFWMLKRAIERGQVDPGTTIIESSSGNLPERWRPSARSWVYPSFQSLTRLCRQSMNPACGLTAKRSSKWRSRVTNRAAT
jgi:hypothetical protein